MHDDCFMNTRNRFNPENRFVGDIENGKRYPFDVYTKEEADARYAAKSLETTVAELAAVVETKADKTELTALAENIAEQFAVINRRLDDLEYFAITIDSFTVSPTKCELGSSNTITCTWALNKTATVQEINGTEVEGTVKQFTNVTAATTYTLTVSDEKNSATKTATVSFANRIYYGVAADLSSVTSLTSVLSNEKKRTITVDAGSGEYIIYAYPARLGNVSFWVDQFEGGFEPAVEQMLTNGSGYQEKYKVYRSTNPNLGETTVEIKEEV